MRSAANLFRMITEMIFVLLGGFLVWLGLSGMIRFFDPRKPAWLGLGALLVIWGVRAWIQTKRAARTSERAMERVGGVSLALIGLLMLGLALVEFRSIGMALAMAGVILIARGMIGAVLSFRMD
jgi:hypothetical protein